MCRIDAFAIRVAINVLNVLIGGFQRLAETKQCSCAEVQSFTTLLRVGIVVSQSIKCVESLIVAARLKIRPANTQQRLSYFRILRVVIDERLPVFSGFLESPITHIDIGSPKMLRRRQPL